MRFKKLKTMLLVSAMSAALTLTGCGNSAESEDTTVTEEAAETETEVEEIEEAEGAAESEESTEEAAAGDEPTDEADESWVQSLYDSLLAEDLDTVFDVIEADDFAGKLTVYDEQDGHFESYDVYTMDDTYVLFLYAYSSEEYGNDAIVGAIPAEHIPGAETLDDYFFLLGYDCADYYITSSISTDDGETTLYRSAQVFDTWYDQYGLEDEEVYDLIAYRSESDAPYWVLELYQALLSGDLDTIYEKIEADDFISRLTVREEDEEETIDYFTIDDETVFVIYSYDTGYYEGYWITSVLIGLLSADETTFDETPAEIVGLLNDNDGTEVWAQTWTTIDNSTKEITYSREAEIYNSHYDDYGL
ncbi:MAG: hypothetical protein LUH07_09330 [Lachnospiraceae bacterium]|nr:hypothetical protein [Lachnospiraceae bacterium]